MIHICQQCGKEFEGQATAKYCSSACRQAAYRSKRAKKPANVEVEDSPRPTSSTGAQVTIDTDLILRAIREAGREIAREIANEISQVLAPLSQKPQGPKPMQMGKISAAPPDEDDDDVELYVVKKSKSNGEDVAANFLRSLDRLQ